MSHWDRRGNLFSAIRWIACAGMLGMLHGNPSLAEVRKETHTYKTVGELAIQADVFRHDDATVRPVVVWLHGGALINGHREAIDSRLKTAMLDLPESSRQSSTPRNATSSTSTSTTATPENP